MKYVPVFIQAIEWTKSNKHHLCQKVLLWYGCIFVLWLDFFFLVLCYDICVFPDNLIGYLCNCFEWSL